MTKLVQIVFNQSVIKKNERFSLHALSLVSACVIRKNERHPLSNYAFVTELNVPWKK